MKEGQETIVLDTISGENFRKSLETAAEMIHSGRLVAFPTETVYGLGGDAYNADAVARVFAAKGRPADNPMILHVTGIRDVRAAGYPDERAEALLREFSPGPLTLVIPAKDSVPLIVRGGLATVAVRIPAHPVALELIDLAGPLVAPSANRSGKPSPTRAAHVLHDLSGRIDAVLDGGPCMIGIESTVVDLTAKQVVILRPGMITAAEIADVIGAPVAVADTSAMNEHAPKAPGMKYRHYAPNAPVRLVVGDEPPQIAGSATLVMTPIHRMSQFPGNVQPLDERTFYAVLREADALHVSEIIIYAAPGEIDAALMDRITKAAGGSE